MSTNYKVTLAHISAETGEMLMFSIGFAKCNDALECAIANATDFISYRDVKSNISIYDIDVLTALYKER